MYELTKREIYEAAKSQFILDYNYQRKQVHKIKRKENADIEHAKHWRVLAEQFDQRANDTFDKIMQLVELINQENHASIKGQSPIKEGFEITVKEVYEKAQTVEATMYQLAEIDERIARNLATPQDSATLVKACEFLQEFADLLYKTGTYATIT